MTLVLILGVLAALLGAFMGKASKLKGENKLLISILEHKNILDKGNYSDKTS